MTGADKPLLCVQLYVERYGDPIRVNMPLDYFLVEEAWAPLKLASDDAAPLTRMMSSPPEVVQRVKRTRANAAEFISKALTKAILQQMESRDTTNGYARSEAKP